MEPKETYKKENVVEILRETQTETVKCKGFFDGHVTQLWTYKVVNETSYHSDTDDKVIQILEDSRINRKRIRIFYGDVETGRDWMEVYDTIGIIGRSCGDVKIPLLIKTKHSAGGGAILDNCIVKITVDKQVVYQHPKYYLPEIEVRDADEKLKDDGYFYSLFVNDKNIYNCKTKEEVSNAICFYKGYRNRF